MDKLQNLYRVEIESFNVYLGYGISPGCVVKQLSVNLFDYEALEFRFITPGSDGVVSWGIARKPFNSYKLGFNVIGSLSGIPNNRKPVSVVFLFDPTTRHLLLQETQEVPHVHILGIYGYIKN